LAKKLIAQETLEGKALEAVFQKASSRSARKGTVTIELAPVKPVAETEPEAKPGKASMAPRLVPKQAPAASD
jgi:hypothetical protein